MIYPTSCEEALTIGHPAYVISGGIGDVIKALYHGMPEESVIWLVSMKGFIDEPVWKGRLNCTLELLNCDDRVVDIAIFETDRIFQEESFGNMIKKVKDLADANNKKHPSRIVSSEIFIDEHNETATLLKEVGKPLVTILPYSAGRASWRGNEEFYETFPRLLLENGFCPVFVGDRTFPDCEITHAVNKIIDSCNGCIDLTQQPSMRATWTAAKMSKFRLSDHTMGHALFSIFPEGSILLSRRKDLDLEALRYYIINYDPTKNLYVFDCIPSIGSGKEGYSLANAIMKWIDKK